MVVTFMFADTHASGLKRNDMSFSHPLATNQRLCTGMCTVVVFIVGEGGAR